ncbi:MAG TPA: hypothetical protein VF742_09205 [Terracidiphilus sp.]|jgi:hypothetical protein
MSSFRRLAFAFALAAFAAQCALAQDSSSSSSSAQQTPQQPDAQQQPANPNQGAVSVQARIRARREQRRAQAIRDVYSHLFETNTSMGYLRWSPGKSLQRVTLYAWDAGVTRYYNEHLGVTLNGRGYYGSPFVGPNEETNSSITNPAISIYSFMAGPTYRFLLEPRYAVSGRVMAGYAHGNFSGDTNGFPPQSLGLYPDGGSFIISVSAPLDYHLSPAMSLRLAPEYVATGFGSSLQNSLGFTGGFAFRFGKH